MNGPRKVGRLGPYHSRPALAADAFLAGAFLADFLASTRTLSGRGRQRRGALQS